MQNPLFSGPEAYERFMGRWSRQLAPLLVRFAGVAGGNAVLDVGCGTGALAAAVAASMPAPAGRIVGIDPSEAYVAFAEAQRKGDAITFQVADAHQLPFDDGAFDRTISMLVLTFVRDPDTALREMRRVTRRGGTSAAAVWDYGGGMEMLRTFWDAAVALDPSAETKDERHLALCREGELGELWRRHGLRDVIERTLTIDTGFASFDDYWTPFLQKQGPAGAYVAGLSNDEREALRVHLRQRLVRGQSGLPFSLKASAWAVRGVVP
jgi:SAM-dependent methyltransferase